MFWNCQPTLNFTNRSGTNGLAIALNGSANVVQHSVNLHAAKRVEHALAKLSFENGYPYILQNEREMMEIASATAPGPDQETIQTLMAQYGVPYMWPEAFVQAVREHMTCYSNVESWFANMKHFDFVTGSRFHGCLIALLAGVPAQMFSHDARTREMCELMSIPHVDISNFGDVDIHQLHDSFDPAPLQNAYRYLYQNYIHFLEENGLEHRLSDN
jgi:hypothetical protein